jgi:hypothetical protein
MEFFENANKAVVQQKNDKNKIIQYFEPQIRCILRVRLVPFIGKIKVVILGAPGFEKNLYDGDTPAPALSQLEELYDGYRPKAAIVDLGYRNKAADGTEIVHPIAMNNNEGLDGKEKDRLRAGCRRRSSGKPINRC